MYGTILYVHDLVTDFQVGVMKRVNSLARVLALAPLMTACATIAGGGGVDESALPTPPTDSAGVSTQANGSASAQSFQSDSIPQGGSANTQNESVVTGSQAGSGTSASQGDGPLEDVPLVIDLSDLRDADGIGNMSIQWQELDQARGVWTKIDGATSQGFTPRQAHVGNRLRVRVEYIDGRGNLESFSTAPTPPVRNVNDLPTGELRLIGQQLQYETLRADTSTLQDEDGMGGVSYQWEISSDGATWQPHRSGEWAGDTVVLSQQEVGRYVRVVLSYTDGFGMRERIESAATDPIKNVNDPVRGDLTVNGSTLVGETLQVDASQLTDRDGIANITLIWEASNDGRTWRRAAESSIGELSLDNSVIGDQIRVRAVVVDRYGNEGTVISGNVGPVESVNSAPTGTVRILSVD